MRVEVQYSYEKGWGDTRTYLRDPFGNVAAQGWAVGCDYSPVPAVLLGVFAVLHGCRLVPQNPENQDGGPPSLITVKAGTQLERWRLLRWFDEGAASAIAKCFSRLARSLPCRGVFSRTWSGSHSGERLNILDDPASAIAGAEIR